MKREDIYIRDPFVFVEDNIGTTDENCWSGKAKSFLGYKSEDLENFEGPYILFENSDDFWANENFWGPELYKIKGKYYTVASFYKEGKNRAVQILVCDEVFGKYIPLEKPFTPKEWVCLDATLYEEDGKLYTVFSHEWVQCRDGEMVLGILEKNLIDLKGEPVVLFKASSGPWVVPLDPVKNTYVTDAPFIYKLSNGNLAMLWSSFGKNGYAIGQLISQNGIKGPWIHIKEPLFSNNGGSAMIFVFKGKTYISFHHPNAPHMKERPFFLEITEENGLIAIK